ncbi:Protein FAR1-RELATED SEQUENCE 5 [Abeliophyllum distichum]|uniref:Protein FAR1-RELATED SEQUENCE n=1 Tax=Abeliophyllum distichum TaxID=126358 RepID=A0ABD1SE11_9LAMI
MQNAISIVFSDTRHRWCLWHILKKLPKKFGGHSHKGAILSAVHYVVYESQSPEDFEQYWNSMICSYDLEDHDWLSGLYRERSRWVPCYLRTSFWAGMSTTQRSESMNAFFDGYVHSKTTLKQFVEQYERALRSKVEKEFQADFKSFSQMIPCATKFGMEKQFQEAYTISKFKEFQEEFSGMVYCRIIAVDEGPLENSYQVADVVADDEVLTREITEWLEMKMTNMNISKNKSSCGSNLISGHSQVHDSTERGLVDKNSSVHMLDPKNSKTKGDPKKLRKKGPLEIGA